MFEIIKTEDPALIAVRICGRITKDEFIQVKTEIEKVISQYGKFRFLIEAADLEVPSPGFFMEDFKFILHNHRNAERVALVGNKTWEKIWLEFVKLLTSVNVRFFDVSQKAQAWEWIKAND